MNSITRGINLSGGFGERSERISPGPPNPPLAGVCHDEPSTLSVEVLLEEDYK